MRVFCEIVRWLWSGESSEHYCLRGRDGANGTIPGALRGDLLLQYCMPRKCTWRPELRSDFSLRPRFCWALPKEVIVRLVSYLDLRTSIQGSLLDRPVNFREDQSSNREEPFTRPPHTYWPSNIRSTILVIYDLREETRIRNIKEWAKISRLITVVSTVCFLDLDHATHLHWSGIKSFPSLPVS